MSAFDHDDPRRGRSGMLGARYGLPPRVESPRIESSPETSPAPATALDWRAWRGEDTYGYVLRLSESGDGYRVHLTCADRDGHHGKLCPKVGKPQDPPAGVHLVSYGGGFLDPQQARELAAALLAYASEKDGE